MQCINVFVVALGAMVGSAFIPLAARAQNPPEITVEIRAHIDGRSQLILHGNTAQWHHFDFAAPGRHLFANFPTTINGVDWFPIWPDIPDAENRFCDCFSDVFTGVVPALPAQPMEIGLQILSVVRPDAPGEPAGTVALVQFPTPENNFTIIVEFDDNAPPGSAFYHVRLRVRTPGLLNDLVAFEPDPSTYTFTADATGCPAGFVGTFSFAARLSNISDQPLTLLTAEVTTITGGNLLQNADGGPAGVGARLTVPQQGEFADGVLSAGEFVDVPFRICMQEREPFSLFVDVRGEAQKTCVEPPAGLVSWWPGEGDAKDIADDNDGTLQGGATFVTGKVGQAFRLDGASNFIEVPNSDSLDATHITIEGWVNIAREGGENFPQHYVVDSRDGFGGGYGLNVDTELIQFFSGTFTADYPSTIQVGQWHHVAATFDGGSMIVFVDGIVIGSIAIPTEFIASTGPFYIGQRFSFDERFDGFIDELAIYNRALSAQEIAAIFNAGSAGKCKKLAQ